MKGLKSLFKREEGAVAVQFALLALPLCVLAFGLMDVNRATVAKQQLQDALDAATLLAARTTTATTDTALTAVGQPALSANLTNLSGATLSGSSFHLNGSYIDSSATVQLTPIVANLWMSGNMNITATSQVVRTMDDLEVAMVLDNTGSMSQTLGSTTKITALKSAASTLVDTLAAAAANSTDPNAVKYAVVPFSMTVNVGSTYQNASWITGVQPTSSGYTAGSAKDNFDLANTNRFTLLTQMGLSWGGCVESRPAPYDIQDTAPVSGTPDTMFIPYFAPDETDPNKASNGSGGFYTANNAWITNDKTNLTTWRGRLMPTAKYASTNKSNITAAGKTAGHGPNEGCATAPLLRLTTSAATAKTTLNSMVATGNTNVAMGLMWGWHVLTPNAPFADGVAYGTAHHDKIVILLTDGDNTNDVYNNPDGSIYTGVGYISQGRLLNTSGVPLTWSSTATQRMDAIDGRELALCANMKAKNIIIYSIGVGVSTHSKGLLQTCASGTDHYYDVTDASQLTTVFNAIAGSIQNLRISK